MNFNWLIPSLLISYIGNDRVPKSFFTGKGKSQFTNNKTFQTSTPTTFHFQTPISSSHDLDYLPSLFSHYFLPNLSSNTLISPMTTKLSLLTLATLGGDLQKTELLRLLEIPPLLNSTELLHHAANLHHFFTTSFYGKSELQKQYNKIQSILFVDRKLFYYDYNFKLADDLENSHLIEGFYPLMNSSTTAEDQRQFEIFKITHLYKLFNTKKLELPSSNSLTTITSFSARWSMPLYNLGPLPFHHNSSHFTTPSFLHRVHHNSRYAHQFETSFVEVPFEQSSKTSFSLIIALPDVSTTLSSLISNLSKYRSLLSILKNLKLTSVSLTLPSFTLTSNFNLSDFLSFESSSNLNLNRLFPSTLFSTPLNSVTQLNSLSLTSTGVSAEKDLLPVPFEPVYVQAEKVVLVNRPFLFMLIGKEGNITEVLFAGTVSSL